jgi:hypothetical protein
MVAGLRIPAILIAVLVGTVPLRAEITVRQAEYAGGVLVVRGETARANQQVTLDGRYKTRTNRYKEFRFRVRYLPQNCGITLQAGQETRPARVLNCEILGVTPTTPPGPATQRQSVATPAGPQVVPLTAEDIYRGWRATHVLGKPVRTKAGESFGIVRNILMGSDGRIVALIVEGPSSASQPEFVYRIPWDRFQTQAIPTQVVADAPPSSQSQFGLFSAEERSRAGEFAVTTVIGDYARLQAGQAYGYVNDVVFLDGRMTAVLVTRDPVAGGGTYAFGFPGTTGRWSPASGYYGLPYVTGQQANGAAVKVDLKRFGDSAS